MFKVDFGTETLKQWHKLDFIDQVEERYEPLCLSDGFG